MQETIARADFDLPGQLGPMESGKVADTYTLENAVGNLLVAVRTDRISAFDVVLDALVPNKGQVLNEMSASMFARTSHLVPNWVLDVPDPNVTIGRKADEVIPLEIVVRAMLTGGIWKKYEAGQRQFSGVQVEDGLQKYQRLPMPIITPTTKDITGDRDISREEIFDTGIANPALLRAMYTHSLRLFQSGREAARRSELQMGDTKYEFGLLYGQSDNRKNSKLIVIDEIHTPDSSRYYDTEELDAYSMGTREEPPTELSKEYFRDWLRSIDYSGAPDQPLPEIPDYVVSRVRDMYTMVRSRVLHETMTIPEDNTLAGSRMRANILAGIDRISGFETS